jgi:hypothetical protein
MSQSIYPRPKFARMTRLVPGVYDDGHGSVHIDADEICAHFGVACTDENYKTLIKAVFDVADDQNIGCVQVTR